MNIKELNEAIAKALGEDVETDIKALNKELYNIVPYELCRTKDTGLLEYIYAYFDDKYEVAWQGGLRNDSRGMLLCYWIDSDNPESLCLYLTSDHDNLFMSGSTHWAVPAKTFEDKVRVLKQIKADIDKLVEDSTKFPKTFYGDTWTNNGNAKEVRLMCSLYVSEKLNGSIGFVYITNSEGKWTAQIMCPYSNLSAEGDSINVLETLKEKLKDRLILNLPDYSNNQSESYKKSF